MNLKIIPLAVMLLLSLMSHHLLIAKEHMGKHRDFSESESPKEMSKSYEGYWSFVREDFERRHPFWPSWMINKAMNTRLYLSKDSFIQYSKPNKVHKEPRRLKEISEVEANHWNFIREESNSEVPFSLTKHGDIWIYREAAKVYQLVKNSPEEVNRWKQNS